MAKRRLQLALRGPVLACLCIAADATGLTIANGGFEAESGPLGGLPDATSDGWSGDLASFVGAENGIAPVEGARMVRLWNTTPNGAGSQTASELWQILDPAEVVGGEVLQLSMLVNRVAGDAQTDSRFVLQLRAYDGDAADFASAWASDELAVSTGGALLSDADPSTWELVATDPFVVPTDATYVVAYLTAVEDVFNDTSGVEFDGHYVDAVVFVPEPAALALTAIGVGLLAARRPPRSRCARPEASLAIDGK